MYLSRAKVDSNPKFKELPLKKLGCDFQSERDAAILRSIQTLQTINDKPLAEFWKSVEKQ